uniref:HYR domain-containing protein n=1 Tax=Flavobacterium sp. TaxID=239 RepID=UPI0037BFFF56
MRKNYLLLHKNSSLVLKPTKQFRLLWVVIFFLGINITINAQSSIYESYAVLNSNGGGNFYYDLQANTGNPDFNGTNLGTFNSDNSLILNGAQNKVYKCNSDDIINGKLYYRIYKTSDVAPSFLNSNMGFSSNDIGAGPGCQNQTWESNGANINVLNGLCPGDYYLEIYTTADFTYTASGGRSETHFASNGGNNYKAIFTVVDTTAPTITCPANISVNNTPGTCGAAVTYATPVGTDNCSGAITTQTAGLASGATFPVGTTTNTFEVTDAAGNKTSCSFTVTVVDNQSPTITCPANISVNNTPGTCGAAVTYATPVGTDNCSGATTTQTAGLASGATFPVGTTTNTFEVTDAAGNKISCSFTVTVVDNQLPTISCPANISVNNTTGTCGASVTYTTPVGTDNCSGATTAQTAGLASGATFPVGVTTNTFEVTDAAGNKTSCSFTVTVVDNQPPTISCPANISVNNTTGTCGASVTYTTPVGTDNCSGATTAQTA